MRRHPRQRTRNLLPCEDGGVAVEFAIVSFALILLCLGTIEFGRALQMRNQLAFAADVAAREILTNASATPVEVETKTREAFQTGDPELLDVVLGTETVDGVQFRTVSLSYPFVLLIPKLADDTITLSVAERVPIT